ncbi:hypothetical protein GPECTOR_52g47 [Gonium pectorale]|uniref:FGFR1 oncogene partner (FOP) N-terminal dimerisation domain-containing protein n=1 Tax=Gonium pectorale TaxID=33097 RepID=A0A150G728_GONPE|nr:hypothetical protein GPECTOR_52g47 [Gonium pectorale]|eukprot:KXZ45647.1 hypothetical protein GPECTOR_52g47 [Gonium pectorale]
MDAIKQAVTQTLEKQGIIAQLKAQLRAQVFIAVDEYESTSSGSGQLVIQLVLDLLDTCNMAFTKKVFQPEIGPGAPDAGRASAASTLGLRPPNPDEPLLLTLVKAYKSALSDPPPAAKPAAEPSAESAYSSEVFEEEPVEEEVDDEAVETANDDDDDDYATALMGAIRPGKTGLAILQAAAVGARPWMLTSWQVTGHSGGLSFSNDYTADPRASISSSQAALSPISEGGPKIGKLEPLRPISAKLSPLAPLAPIGTLSSSLASSKDDPLAKGPKPLGPLTAPVRKSLPDIEKEKEELRRLGLIQSGDLSTSMEVKEDDGAWTGAAGNYGAGGGRDLQYGSKGLSMDFRETGLSASDRSGDIGDLGADLAETAEFS